MPTRSRKPALKLVQKLRNAHCDVDSDSPWYKKPGLVTATSFTSVVGDMVRVEQREDNGGSMSAHARRIHHSGLGCATKIDILMLRWPVANLETLSTARSSLCSKVRASFLERRPNEFDASISIH
jgi:hypothetical protein